MDHAYPIDLPPPNDKKRKKTEKTKKQKKQKERKTEAVKKVTRQKKTFFTRDQRMDIHSNKAREIHTFKTLKDGMAKVE